MPYGLTPGRGGIPVPQTKLVLDFNILYGISSYRSLILRSFILYRCIFYGPTLLSAALPLLRFRRRFRGVWLALTSVKTLGRWLWSACS